jgi:arginine deiminase
MRFAKRVYKFNILSNQIHGLKYTKSFDSRDNASTLGLDSQNYNALTSNLTIKKLIPDINKEHQRILTEISTGKTQLTHLKQALAEGSTHDAAGNKITEEYIDKVYAEETKTARDLIAQLGQLFERVPLADRLYQANYSKVRFWVDRIPKVQTPTLAVPK